MTTVSETLNKAADLIEERGWTNGLGGWNGYDGLNQPLCLEGAIMAALGWKFDEINVDDVDTCPAGRAVHAYLNTDKRYLFTYNDQAGRTAAEVIEVLRATALIESARETEAEAAAIIAGALSQPVVVFEVARA